MERIIFGGWHEQKTDDRQRNKEGNVRGFEGGTRGREKGPFLHRKRGGPAVEAGRKVDLAGMRTDVFSIPLSEITREAKFYEAMVGEVPVRFFVMMSSDGVIRSALDACDTCAHTLKGYRQEGDFMVCNNCDQRFPSTKINVVRGGCNPVPLNNETKDGELRIRVADIQQCTRYFDFKR
jgi:hypothetical protein